MGKKNGLEWPAERRGDTWQFLTGGLLLAVLLPSVSFYGGADAAPVTMTYSYSNLFDGGLTRERGFSSYEMLLAVEEGLSLWSEVVPLTFVEQIDSGPPVSDNPYSAAGHPDIRIGHHEFSGNTLAHAYFPGGAGLSSDLHLDDNDRTWSERLFLTTVTHELGHAIGVDHIDGVLSIMNTTLGGDNVLAGLGQGALFQPEIDAVREIWGEGSGEVISQRVWQSSDTSDWLDHENWDRGWRPTQHADTWIQTDSQVHLSTGDQVVRSLTLAGGQNVLEIDASGSLKVQHDVMLGVSSGGSVLVAAGSPARTLVPTDNSSEATWSQPEFDDGSWTEGPTGIGYDRAEEFRSLIGTDVESQMYDLHNSVYTRIEFEVAAPEDLAFLNLAMKYDDGFAAYLNGTPIASANSPSQPRWNSTATGSHPDEEATEFEEFDVSDALQSLQPGRNVLAIQGLNRRTTSSDLLLLPELRGGMLDNTLRLSGGGLQIEGNLHLASEPFSRSTVQLDGGELQVRGQITTGVGQSRLEMRAGTLRVLGDLDTEPAAEGGTLSVDQLELYGGQIEGVRTIEADVLHHSGVFDPRPLSSDGDSISQLTIVGDYRMDADAVLEFTLSDTTETLPPALQIHGAAQLAGTLSIVTDPAQAQDVDRLAPGQAQSIVLISVDALDRPFPQLLWNENPFLQGHQGKGLFRSLRYADTEVQLYAYRALPGDALGDGLFTSEDLVRVFQVGKYEDGIPENADWTEGDWDGDLDVTSSDLIAAFQTGLYERPLAAASYSAVPEPTGFVLLLIATPFICLRYSQRLGGSAVRFHRGGAEAQS